MVYWDMVFMWGGPQGGYDVSSLDHDLITLHCNVHHER